MFKEKKFLIILFLISFLIRSSVFLFYLSKNENYWQVDSNTYHLIAENIAQNKGISADGQNPNFYRLPGYPLFLSIYYKFFGPDKKNALWLQIILASFIPILIFFFSLALFPENILLAKVASLYSCFHLGLVLYSGFYMTESLFLFLFLLFFILLFKNAFLAGLFLGLAGLVRPVGHYLIIISIFVLFLSCDFIVNKLKKGLLFFIGWLIPVLPWLLRNYILLGQFFFHTLPGGHFLYFSATRVAMHPYQCTYQESREIIDQKRDVLFKKQEEISSRDLSEIEKCNIMQNLAVRYFKKYPLITLKHWLTDIMRTSLSLYSGELVLLDNDKNPPDYFSKDHTIWTMFKRYLFPQTNNIALRFIIILEILTFIFILMGFFLGLLQATLNGSEYCVWVKILPFITLFIVIGLSGGFSRMRLPIEPFLIVLSLRYWISWFVASNHKKSF